MVLEVKNYKPPFITETDEARWEDCTMCSTLMGIASWTLGEVVTDKSWRPFSKADMKSLRERMRNTLGPANQSGGLNLSDTARAVELSFPELPPMPRFDRPGDDYTFNMMLGALRDNSVVIAQGNPIQVKNAKSGLRRWTNRDDFGHAVLFERANDTHVYVMDPLGSGKYDGQWIPIREVKEFLFFTSGHEPLISILERGGQSREVRATAQLQKTVNVQSKSIATLKTQAGDLTKQRDALTSQLAGLTAERDALKTQLDSVTQERDALKAGQGTSGDEQIVALTTERDALKDQVEALNTQVTELREEVDSLTKQLAEAQADTPVETPVETIPAPEPARSSLPQWLKDIFGIK